MSGWSMYGTSDFPLNQPMVGQKEFFYIFKAFTRNMKNAGLTTIFPLISKWGVGKSRIAFEIVSEALGMDRGWIITEDGKDEETVRILKPNFEDNILPLYIRYSQMYHEDLVGDNWVAYGIYTSLKTLSMKPDGSIQGKIIEAIQNALMPCGFDRDTLNQILQTGTSPDDLVADGRKLDEIVRKSIDYIKKIGINHILIICDELETEAEIAKYGIEKDRDLISKIDGESIKVITSAIKHEDPRKKYPDVSYLLLCSNAIGGSIQGIGALDRRTEMYEMHHNSFADIRDFTDYLNKNNMVPSYPEGLIEAAYAIAGGNFGWFNVIMALVDDQVKSGTKSDTGIIFENILNSSSRFQNSLIDKSAFDYINCDDRYRQLVKQALLRQIPVNKTSYNQEEITALMEAKAEDGEKLFKEFYSISIPKDDLALFLTVQGYKRESGDMFVNNLGGKFDLHILLKSLKTFSINVKEQEFITGKEEETFLDQVRMLYPLEDIEEAARYIYQYIKEKAANNNNNILYTGPNFAYLSRLNKRYRVEKDDFGYVPENQKNKEIEKLIQERAKDKKGEVKRILSGICRALEIRYPGEEPCQIKDIDCVRTEVENNPYLDVRAKGIVDIIWGKDEEKIEDVLKDNKLIKDGGHPVIVISDTIFNHDLTSKFVKDKYEGTGKCLIFITITRVERDLLEAMSLPKEILDIRENKNQITVTFRDKIRKLRDHFNESAKKWFDKIDEEGWILRPVIYKKSESRQIELLARAYKTMLINKITFEELGTKPGVKFTGTDYEELKTIVKNTFIGSMDEGKGYKETGLFAKEFYDIAVKPCMNRIIKFNKYKKVKDEYKNRFFFSVSRDNKIKHEKILEQWLDFMAGLNLLQYINEFIERTSDSSLNNQYDLVKYWLEVDCQEEIKKMETLIRGPYLDVLKNTQIPLYKSKLKEAEIHKGKVNIEILETIDDRNFDKFREVINHIDKFRNICYEIYDKKEWDSIKSYNPNIIKDIKIDDKEKPLWFRIKHIRLFIDYVNNIKDKAVKAIENKIKDIKNNSTYQGYSLPLSPMTNIFERYNNEFVYSTNYKQLQSSKSSIMVKDIDTLAFKLQEGNYSGACKRIEDILENCGLIAIGGHGLNWSHESGIIFSYKKIFEQFKHIIDGYNDQKESKRWVEYFEYSPGKLKNDKEVVNLKNCMEELEIFVENGLQQIIDDNETDLLIKPDEFLELLQNNIEKMHQYVGEGLIKGHRDNVKNIARTEKNQLYDELLIEVIDKLRKLQSKSPASVNINKETYPSEKTYNDTCDTIKKEMDCLIKEGNAFFEHSKIDFNFFKDVVKEKGEIDWNDYTDEKKELEDLKLIRTKVEVI